MNEVKYINVKWIRVIILSMAKFDLVLLILLRCENLRTGLSMPSLILFSGYS
jgi:hypothetical protein